ncbi:MAG: hypothetical protein HY394_01185 [Candidatus Diapherotrites archaeon]|nr:hypothetical protein [Candidatus Diapherotrites archaeon]
MNLKVSPANAKTSGIALLAIALVFVGAFFALNNPSGFLSLAAKSANGKTADSAGEKGADSAQEGTSAKTTAVSAQISFEVLGRTALKARPVEGRLLPCPQYSQVVVEIENAGAEKAEKVSLRQSENVKVENCTNCDLDALGPGEKALAKMKACIIERQNAFVEASAVNAEKSFAGLD